jgi:hypothetical protein
MVDVLTMIGGAFLVVSSMVFAAPVLNWLAFGVSAGLAVILVASLITEGRTGARISRSAMAVVAAWSLIAALVFTGPALTWLVFADALALGGLALADLTAHEVTTERVVHELEIPAASRPLTRE